MKAALPARGIRVHGGQGTDSSEDASVKQHSLFNTDIESASPPRADSFKLGIETPAKSKASDTYTNKMNRPMSIKTLNGP